MLLTVAVIGAPHGLRGEVRLDVRTDDPGRRLAVGQVLETEPSDAGPLTVSRFRAQGGSTYVHFEEARDRGGAEALRGVRLVVESDEDEDEGDDEGWYPHELVGMRVRHVDGRELGTVAELEHFPAQDVLLVTEPDGAQARVPFVAELVPEVDVDAGVITVDPPRGLFAADPGEEDDEAGDDGPATSPSGDRPASGA
ncbi:ribosome maturation factor RimM [Georgenia muralis]|uniref:Ribosome maturation factor RimM n=1 Tax=Georgenia muralis TaxID=154117 RepID=A0A3N4Z664_9MICO|nr:ribosome maturation factor RimM [Georgenia muralis]RPF27827.1 16S rRNA processing protein RimM [Georgenia muralis]